MKILHIILINLILIFTGCYSKIGYFEKIELNNEIDSKNSNLTPFVFYRECTKSGNSWLYLCQIIGLNSIYQVISLEKPHVNELNNTKMFFDIKNSYIRFEIYDEKIK